MNPTQRNNGVPIDIWVKNCYLYIVMGDKLSGTQSYLFLAPKYSSERRMNEGWSGAVLGVKPGNFPTPFARLNFDLMLSFAANGQ